MAVNPEHYVKIGEKMARHRRQMASISETMTVETGGG